MDQRVGGGVMPFPVGWRFAPTEEEVVMFLSDKAALRSLPAGIIKDMNASDFFSKHPRDIGFTSGVFPDTIMGYFLIHDDTFFHGKKEKKRAVDEIGFWRYAGKEEAVCDINGNIIAYKVHSTFFNAKPSTRKTCWNMEEYWLPNINRGSELDEEQPREHCVVARLKRGRN